MSFWPIKGIHVNGTQQKKYITNLMENHMVDLTIVLKFFFYSKNSLSQLYFEICRVKHHTN